MFPLIIAISKSGTTVRNRRPPVIMTRAEVKRVLANIIGNHLLMANLLYGSGLRLMECIRLRVQDVDFERCEYPRGSGIDGPRRC